MVCQAAKEGVNAQQLVAAAALATALSLGAVDAAKADISGLTPCSKSKAFAKLEKKELKKLTQRKKQARQTAAGCRQGRSSAAAAGEPRSRQ